MPQQTEAEITSIYYKQFEDLVPFEHARATYSFARGLSEFRWACAIIIANCARLAAALHPFASILRTSL
jgi:hypothetical protein